MRQINKDFIRGGLIMLGAVAAGNFFGYELRAWQDRAIIAEALAEPSCPSPKLNFHVPKL